MNYEKIYNDLIESRKNRQLIDSEYYEIHHIFPKALGGTNEASNLIKLTAREHFLAHWLLYRLHKNKEMTFAFFAMASGMKSNDLNKKKFSSIAYAEAKEAKSKQVKILNTKYKKNHIKSEETRKKLSGSLKGKKFTPEHSSKISDSLTGKSKTLQTRKKISLSLTGFDWSSYFDRNEKISKANLGKGNGRARKILQKSVTCETIMIYDTMDDARKVLSKMLNCQLTKSKFHRIVNQRLLVCDNYWEYTV